MTGWGGDRQRRGDPGQERALVMVTSPANVSSEEQINEVQELRGHGLSVRTDSCKPNNADLFSLLGQDIMG